MTKLRSVGVAAVFLVGCAVGGGASAFVVPKASAQQAATLTKWEYTCFSTAAVDYAANTSNKLGLEGWEMSGVDSTSTGANWCFKRPRM